MNAKMIEKLSSKASREVDAIVKELEGTLHQIKYQQSLLAEAEVPSEKAECLDSINSQIRRMKSHINETALAYIAGMFDAEED